MKNLLFDIKSAKPFLKWAGGKSQIIADLESRLPYKIKEKKIIDNYVEPFIGGGAFFFFLSSNYKIKKSTILDINPELFIAYNTIKLNPKELVSELKVIENKYLDLNSKSREVFFYDIRLEYNLRLNNFDFNNFTNDWIKRTAQLIFLNRTCFNGLFRQNKKGEFNVPYGNYKNPLICNSDNIFKCSKVLANTNIIKGDFSKATDFIDKNTLVYLDPPYRPIKNTSSFTSYSKDGFNDDDQIRLSKFYKEMSEKGAYLLLSNSDPKNENPDDNFFENIYYNFIIEKIPALRMINCNGQKRGQINELIILNYTSNGGEEFNENLI